MPSTSYAKNLSHARWYFISNLSEDNTLPKQLLEKCSHSIVHYTPSNDDETRYLMLGYIHLKERMIQRDIHLLTRYQFQWIPAILAHTAGDQVSVDFKKWKEEDFDIHKFSQESYPWNQITELIYSYDLVLLSTSTMCPNKDSVVIYTYLLRRC